MSIKNNIISLRLQNIANFLMLNSKYISNIGLLNGKLGIAIFLYKYSHFSKNTEIESFAGDLVDQVYDDINQNVEFEFENGLAGIGWGIEYLVQNGYLEAETDDILSEVDLLAKNEFTKNPFLIIESQDFNSLGLYYIKRLKGQENYSDLKTLKKKQMVIYLLDSCERLLTKTKCFDLKVPQLSIRQLNSVLYFLLESYHLNIFPIQTKKLLGYIPCNYALNAHEDFLDVDKKIFTMLRKNIRGIENPLPFGFFSIEMLYDSKHNIDNEIIINEFINMGWNSLLYSISLAKEKSSYDFFEKIAMILESESLWNNYINNLNAKKMGLYKGIAGMGLSLLEFS